MRGVPRTPWPEAIFRPPRRRVGKTRFYSSKNRRFYRLFLWFSEVPCLDPDFRQKVTKMTENDVKMTSFSSILHQNASLAPLRKFVNFESKMTRFRVIFDVFSHIWGFNVFSRPGGWFLHTCGVSPAPPCPSGNFPTLGPDKSKSLCLDRGFEAPVVVLARESSVVVFEESLEARKSKSAKSRFFDFLLLFDVFGLTQENVTFWP